MQVTYDSHMGDDLKVANMARVSFSKRSDWVLPTDGNASHLSPADKSLIQFLARGCTSGDWGNILDEAGYNTGDYSNVDTYSRGHLENILNHVRKMPSHWAPFAHCQVTLHMIVPLPMARQLFKHKVGGTASDDTVESEQSNRYIDDGFELFIPDFIRVKGTNIKQGSLDEKHPRSDYWIDRYTKNGNESIKEYNDMIADGVPAEQSRFALPQGILVQFYQTQSLYGWANLHNQRSDPHAQKETRQVAEMVREIVEPLFPESWRALTA